jgi:hypothetical protein
MTQAFSLDRLIRQVASDASPSLPDEKLVIIDLNMKKAIARKRLFHPAKYFVVTNNKAGRTGVEGAVPTIQIRDFSNDRTVALTIYYHANCEPGNEEKVAESLFDGPHPGAVLNEIMRKYLTDYIGHRSSEFIDKYYERQTDLQAFIIHKVYQETGLNLQVKIYLDGEQQLRSIFFGPLNLSVRVRDYDVNQQMTVRGELEVDEGNKIHAVLYRAGDWTLEELVRRETYGYFAEKISLHRFCTELNGSVKQSLVERLNEALQPVGRRIGFLALESDATNIESATTEHSVTPFFEINQPVECIIQQYPEPVIIKNTVQMILQDIAKYKADKSPPLNRWVEKKLERVIHELLFDAQYIDLLLDFDATAEKIKQRLSVEAESIGYAVKQLVAVPDLEPLSWLEFFPINVQQSFSTKYAGAKVELQIIGSAKINDLRDVKHLLNPGQNIPRRIEKTIIQEISGFLHEVDPERFYMRFSFGEDSNEKSVEEEINERIKKLVAETFHAEIIQIVLKVVDTDYIIHLRNLQKEMGKFTVEIFPLHQEAIEPFLYLVKFRVEAVDASGWNQFHLLNSSMEKIQQHLQDSVQAKLATLPSEILAFKNVNQLRAMEEAIENLAKESVKKEFGLVIRISMISRELTGLEDGLMQINKHRWQKSLEKEKEFIDQTVEKEVRSYQSTLLLIYELEEKLKEYIKADEDEDEIKRLEKRITKLRKTLPAGQIAQKSEFARLYPSESSGKTSLQDFKVAKALPAGELQDEEADK